VTVPLVAGFQTGTSAMQFVELEPWIPRFNVNYHLGVDGISVLFILLNSFITVLVVIAGWEVIRNKVAQYMAAFLVMSGLLNGTFAALDAVLFYVFFEATLIRCIWSSASGEGRTGSTRPSSSFCTPYSVRFLMLIAFLYLYNKSGGSFAVLDYHKLPLPLNALDPAFHRLPYGVRRQSTHVARPHLAPGRARRGADRRFGGARRDPAQLGAYGFVRFSLPILPDASRYLAGFMITLSLIAIVYIGLVALVQTDMKKLIAYSSISHMGFVTLGFFIFNPYGMEGGLVQMISHGFVSAALFLCVGVLYDRMHSRNIADYGGVANTMPKFAALMLLFAMANCGLPATSGFVGESW